ncbi:3-ketoacyl-ACP reductase [Oscillospiraceae bacterium PP1C4]
MAKTAIVTGGSRGIGLGIVKQLAADGFAVVIVAVSPIEQYQETFDQLTKDGVEYLYLQGSISDAADRERCIAETLKKYGRIDVLVNNAGVAPQVRADLLEMTEQSFDRVIAINTKGTMFMSQAVAKQMIKQEEIDGVRGIIVNVGSMSAEVSSTSRGEYCVSKAGIAMLTSLYADRLAGESIFVYEVRPGIIATDMTSSVKEKYDALFEQGICPIKRWGTPADVASAVSVFCSGKLRYTTGQYIDVDGGFHIKRL